MATNNVFHALKLSAIVSVYRLTLTSTRALCSVLYSGTMLLYKNKNYEYYIQYGKTIYKNGKIVQKL